MVFACDPAQAARHNAEVREVIAAWRADRPIRVPLLMDESPFQFGVLAYRETIDHLRYYQEPEEMLRIQLAAATLRRELPIADVVLAELPERWTVGVDLHPVIAPGWIGCSLTPRRDSVIAHHPRDLPRTACDAEPMPDPRTGGILPRVTALHQALATIIEPGLTHLGRPVQLDLPAVSHYGVLAMGLDLRGHELLMDLYDDPEFVARFLMKMGTWCDALDRAWATPSSRPYFNNTDHGIDLLPAETYEALIVPVIKEMNRRRGTGLPTGIHHCGRGAHLFPVIRRHFPLQRIDDLNYPLNDVAWVRSVVGPEVWIKAEIEAGIVQTGPSERIRQTVRNLMTSGAKGNGRLAIVVGDLLPGTPLEHRLALYEAVREFGAY